MGRKQNTFRNEVKVTGWASERTKEAFEKVAKDEARKLSIIQENMIRSTDYLRHIIAPVGGQGGVTMSYLCPHCNSFPIEDYVWWVSEGEKHTTNWWCTIFGKKTTGSNQTGSWWCNQAKVLTRPRSLKCMQYLRECAEVAGEPTGRWRWPHTEHRDEPL